MIKTDDIMTVINELIIELYPASTIYVQTCPKDFVRPSFWLEHIRTASTDVNKITVDKTVYFSITGFTSIDKHFRSKPADLLDVHDNILKLFAKGYIIVGDRAIKVRASTGGTDIDRAYIDIQFEFFDNRTDEVNDDPLITLVTTKILEG